MKIKDLKEGQRVLLKMKMFYGQNGKPDYEQIINVVKKDEKGILYTVEGQGKHKRRLLSAGYNSCTKKYESNGKGFSSNITILKIIT